VSECNRYAVSVTPIYSDEDGNTEVGDTTIGTEEDAKAVINYFLLLARKNRQSKLGVHL
jgi:hypothetical protein